MAVRSPGGSTVDLASPGTIGGTTPGAATFTRITLTTGTITVSTPQINGTQTWNDGAVTFTGWKLNVTDTASAAASLLADFQVAGSSKFNIRKDGSIIGASDSNLFGAATVTIGNGTSGYARVMGGIVGIGGTGGFSALMEFASQMKVVFRNNSLVGFASSGAEASAETFRGNLDSAFARNAAGVIEINNGTAGTFRDLKLRTLIVGGTQATTMTDGFIQVPGAAGAATGVPTDTTGVSLYYDKTNNKLMAYNGAWRASAAFT